MKQTIDYIPMVKTVPELSKRDGGVYTCSIGYSPQIGFIRVYPLPLTQMKRWGIYQIEIEKNKQDSRQESWKLATYTRKDNFIGFEKELIYKGDCNRAQIMNLARAIVSNSIEDLNKGRKSIGFVLADTVNAYWDVNNKYINTKQLGLFEDVEIADFAKYMKATKEKECRLSFRDADGKHDLMLNDWQYYEYQRKFGANKEAFRHFNNCKSLILLGNMFQYRSTWIALGCYRVNELMPSKSNQMQMF